MPTTPDRRIPVTVLGGFLGSGKTTVLRHVLRDPAFADSAVLINEFGEVGLDHLLVDTLDAAPVLLANGCVCCTIRGDLSAAIRDLHARRQRGAVPPFRRLIVETTGLADPAPVVATILSDLVLRHHVRPGALVVTVDGQAGRLTLGRHAVARRQAAAADLLVVTKTDLAPPAELDALRAALPSLNPVATIAEAAHGRIDPALLDERGREFGSGPRALAAPPSPSPHGEARAFAIERTEPIGWSAFGIWFSLLAHRHGARLLRMKGVLRVEGSATPVAVHAVGPAVYPPEHLPSWPDGESRSRLVFVVDGLDPAPIERSFALFHPVRPG